MKVNCTSFSSPSEQVPDNVSSKFQEDHAHTLSMSNLTFIVRLFEIYFCTSTTAKFTYWILYDS